MQWYLALGVFCAGTCHRLALSCLSALHGGFVEQLQTEQQNRIELHTLLACKAGAVTDQVMVAVCVQLGDE